MDVVPTPALKPTFKFNFQLSTFNTQKHRSDMAVNKSVDSIPTSPMRTLPKEILVFLLRHLDIKDLAHMESTSRYMQSVIEDGKLWKKLVRVLSRKAIQFIEDEIKKLQDMKQVDPLNRNTLNKGIETQEDRSAQLESILNRSLKDKRMLEEVIEFRYLWTHSGKESLCGVSKFRGEVPDINKLFPNLWYKKGAVMIEIKSNTGLYGNHIVKFMVFVGDAKTPATLQVFNTTSSMMIQSYKKLRGKNAGQIVAEHLAGMLKSAAAGQLVTTEERKAAASISAAFGRVSARAKATTTVV